MQFERRFTTPGTDIFAQLSYRKASSEIRNPDGTIVFSAQDIEVPEAVQSGGNRYSGAKIFPQSRRSGSVKKNRRK